MQLRSLFASICAAAVSAFAHQPAQAQLLVSEPFDYPVDSELRGQSGGSGFAGAWFEGGGFVDRDVIVLGSLATPGLATAGNSLRSLAPTNFGSDLSRSLAQPIAGTPGSVLWVSFTMRKNDEGDGTYASQHYFGLVLYPSDPNAPALFIGDTGETDFYSLGIAGAAEGQVASNVQSVVSASATLLVVKITFADGPDTVELFVNPDPRAAEPVLAAAVKNDLDIADISAFGVLAGYDAEWNLDGIHIGNRFIDAVPREIAMSSVYRQSGGAVVLQAVGAPSQSYTVQSTTDLTQPFEFLATVSADTSGNVTFTDAAPAAKRFYRILYPE